MTVDVDVLMVTHRRPDYLQRSLPRLLDQCDGIARVWLWHNGGDDNALTIVRKYADHPAVAEVRHCAENVGQVPAINWLFEQAEGKYLSKVDDDCLVADGWIEELRAAHESVEKLGVVGTWRFFPEDFVPELAERKMIDLPGGHRLLRNHWVQGSGFLLKRECVEIMGRLGEREMLPSWFTRLGLDGWVNGWVHPFIREDHMDDPRSPNTAMRSDEDLLARMPLTAARHGVTSLDDWIARLQATARDVQAAPLDAKYHRGWRRQRDRLRRRLRRLKTGGR